MRASCSIVRRQAMFAKFGGSLSNDFVAVTTILAYVRAISRTNSSKVAANRSVAEFAAAIRAFGAPLFGSSNAVTSKRIASRSLQNSSAMTAKIVLTPSLT
jgi:hypothetical protein